MPHLSVEALSVHAGAFRLSDINLSLDPGRTLVLLGPSGAGKTVLLETLAGFRKPVGGRIELGGQDITRVPPEERRIGFMFQDYALFPHLSVLENVRFGLRARGERDLKPASSTIERLGLDRLASRKPGGLSGGERQRAALARALVIRPRLLLLDEPLSALDAPSRAGVRDHLLRLLRDLGITTIYVTHDQSEALALADDLAILLEGRLRQAGPADRVYDNPVDTTVARFLGMEVLGEATCIGRSEVAVDGRSLRIGSQVECSERDVLCYRPEDVELLPAGDVRACNCFELCVTEVAQMGPLVRLRMKGEGLPSLTALVFRRTVSELGLREGSHVRVHLSPYSLKLVPLAANCYP